VIGEGSAHRIKGLITTEIADASEIALPARAFDALLSSISGAEVRMSQTSAMTVELRCADHRTELRTIDVQDVPSWPQRSFVDLARLSAQELAEAIRRTAFVATDEDTVTLLAGGVLLDERDSHLRLTGMDRTRLSISTLPSAQYQQSFEAVVVPARSLMELERLDWAVDELSIAKGDTEIRFACLPWELRSRTIATPVPEFDSRIPNAFATTASLPRGELLEALSVAAILSTDEPRSVRLQLNAQKQLCIVTTKGSQLGTQRSQIPATIVGEDTVAEVSVRILHDGVRISTRDPLRLQVTEAPLQRCIVQTTERENDVYVFAVVA
jgi:DNA polymerase III sliding clamp (beta) subunit (PCNA family)